jgi:hypothetical protein
MSVPLQPLLQAVTTFDTIGKFVTDGELVGILSTIGDVHMHAASEVLEKLGNAKDRRGEIRSVITHLQAAHSAYEDGHRKLNGLAGRLADWSTRDELRYRDLVAMMLLVICYVYIDENTRASDYFPLLREYARYDDMPYIPSTASMPVQNLIGGVFVALTGLALLNPRTYINLAAGWKPRDLSGIELQGDIHSFIDRVQKLLK